MIMDSKTAVGILNCGVSQSIGQNLTGRLKINVSGQKFEISRQNIVKHPNTRLGKILLGKRHSFHKEHIVATTAATPIQLYDDYDSAADEYFFERNPTCFPLVISFYIGGILHIPRHVCVELFQEEMEYWGMPFHPEACCQGYHQQEWEINETVRKTNDLFESRCQKTKKPGRTGTGKHIETGIGPPSKTTIMKRKIWDLFENSESSRAASVSLANDYSFFYSQVP